VIEMIEILQESHGNMLAIKGCGTLTDSDYEELLIPTLERIMKEHHKARLLFVMGDDFKGWNMGAAWRYAKFGFTHKNDFEKVAAVCGPKWVQWTMKLKSFFIPAEIRTFSCGERSEAFDWIEA
jgi:SpoIIAA-like